MERIGGAERCVAVLTRLQTLLYPPPPTPTDVSAAEQQVSARHSSGDSDADNDGCDHGRIISDQREEDQRIKVSSL